MSDELLALAKRCEEAGGPDRQLDLAIARALGLTPQLNGSINISGKVTASIDAALTLVPEGWQGDGLKWWEGECASCDLVGSTLQGDQWVRRFNDGRVSACGQTAALALCAAALRALATQPTDQVQP